MIVVLVPNMAERMPWKSEAGNSSFSFPLASHRPSRNPWGQNLNKSHQVSQAKGKKLGARSKRQEVSTQRKETAITHPTLLCHTASWGVTQPSGYTFHSSSYLRKFFWKVVFVLGLVAQVIIPATYKAEVWRLKAQVTVERVQSKPGQLCDTLFQIKGKRMGQGNGSVGKLLAT